MAIIPGSPVQLGVGEYRFPERTFKKLYIRAESGGTFKTVIKLNNTVASSTNADIFLDGGEAIVIEGVNVIGALGSNISIINVTGDPKIYWNME